MRNIVYLIYVKESVGTTLFDELAQYPQLFTVCNELCEIAVEYEIDVLLKKGNVRKEQVKNKLMTIDALGKTIPQYRQSLIFFDETGAWSDLI